MTETKQNTPQIIVTLKRCDHFLSSSHTSIKLININAFLFLFTQHKYKNYLSKMRRSTRQTKRNSPSGADALHSQNERKEKGKRKKVKRGKKHEDEEMSQNENTLPGGKSMSEAVVVGVDDAAVERQKKAMTEDANSLTTVFNSSEGVDKTCLSLLSTEATMDQSSGVGCETADLVTADINDEEKVESEKSKNVVEGCYCYYFYLFSVNF